MDLMVVEKLVVLDESSVQIIFAIDVYCEVPACLPVTNSQAIDSRNRKELQGCQFGACSGSRLDHPPFPFQQGGGRKVALPFLFLFLQVFSVFSEKSFLPFCMGNFKKRSKMLFSFSFFGFSQFSQRNVFSFLLHLAFQD
jgi:hypothetical protein